jgi:hypothetical protein
VERLIGFPQGAPGRHTEESFKPSFVPNDGLYYQGVDRETADRANIANGTRCNSTHPVVPIVRRIGWTAAKGFCRQIASSLASAAPERYTISSSKAARIGKIYIDYLRNSE